MNEGLKEMIRSKILLQQVGESWYAFNQETGIWGQASSTEAALKNMKDRSAEFETFLNVSGFKPIDSNALRFRVHLWGHRTLRFFRTFFLLSLLSIPIAYGIQSGMKYGAKEVDKIFDKSGSWKKIDKFILRLGDEKYQLTSDEQQQLKDAIQRIKNRYSPFWQDENVTNEQ